MGCRAGHLGNLSLSDSGFSKRYDSDAEDKRQSDATKASLRILPGIALNIREIRGKVALANLTE